MNIRQAIRDECWDSYDGGWDWGYIIFMSLITVLGFGLVSFLAFLLAWSCLVAPYHWPVIPVFGIPYVLYKFWYWVLKDDSST